MGVDLKVSWRDMIHSFVFVYATQVAVAEK